jgi:hypothetical protein
MKKLLFVPLLGAAVLWTGCETTPQERRSAGVGAATGAIAGGVIGGDVRGAAIGAAIGGAAGGLYERGRRSDGGVAAERDAVVMSEGEIDYLALMTEEEIDILRRRAQASGRTNFQLTDFLTEEERANLRARAGIEVIG